MRKEEIIQYVNEHATGTILSFPDRGPWGNPKYRGNFSGWIPASILVRYGCRSVSEIFAGSGTTSDLCKDLGIPYCGIDLNPNPVRTDISFMDILDYGRELPDGFYEADLQMLHPPYPGINDIHYSNGMWLDDKGLTNADIQEMPWAQGMHAVVVGDIRRKGIFRSMLTNLTLPGEQVQILVKAQHNTVSGNRTYNNNQFFFIEHEFVVITKKPSGYEIAFVVPQHFTMDIRDSQSTTWKDVVYAVLRQLGASASLDKIYEEIEPHKKAQGNPHWKAKVRQTLQMLAKTGSATHVSYGKWCVA